MESNISLYAKWMNNRSSGLSPCEKNRHRFHFILQKYTFLSFVFCLSYSIDFYIKSKYDGKYHTIYWSKLAYSSFFSQASNSNTEQCKTCVNSLAWSFSWYQWQSVARHKEQPSEISMTMIFLYIQSINAKIVIMVLLSQIVVFLIVVVKLQYLVNGALSVVVLLVVVVVKHEKNVNDHALLFFSRLKCMTVVHSDLENWTYSLNIFTLKSLFTIHQNVWHLLKMLLRK